MDGIFEKLNNFIKEILMEWVSSNLADMFTDVNHQVEQIAGEVSRTPATWNATIFTMIEGLSESVIIPIAGIVIAYVLCYELISMVMEKNNMQDFDMFLFFRYLLKAGIGVWLVSNTFNITMAVFDMASSTVNSAAAYISGNTGIDMENTFQEMLETSVALMGIGELIALGIESSVVKLGMKVMSVLITVILYGRMIEIYLYISISPVPFATFTNREWGDIGTNYLKGLFALAFQGFFIMVCVAIYAVLVSGIAYADNIHSAIWSAVGYAVLLCFALFQTGGLSKSIFHAM